METDTMTQTNGLIEILTKEEISLVLSLVQWDTDHGLEVNWYMIATYLNPSPRQKLLERIQKDMVEAIGEEGDTTLYKGYATMGLNTDHEMEIDNVTANCTECASLKVKNEKLVQMADERVPILKAYAIKNREQEQVIKTLMEDLERERNKSKREMAKVVNAHQNSMNLLSQAQAHKSALDTRAKTGTKDTKEAVATDKKKSRKRGK
jgi:hypothetical protein